MRCEINKIWVYLRAYSVKSKYHKRWYVYNDCDEAVKDLEANILVNIYEM